MRDLELLILLPPPPEFWDCRLEPSHSAGDQTQAFVYAKRALCQLSHILSPTCVLLMQSDGPHTSVVI